MKLNNFLLGIAVLRPYYPDDGYHLGAEHDAVYLMPTPAPLSPEDAARMRELGWIQENVDDEAYDPAESWCAYV